MFRGRERARTDDMTMLALFAVVAWVLCVVGWLRVLRLRRQLAALTDEVRSARAVLHMQHTMICSLARALRGETPAPVDEDETRARN